MTARNQITDLKKRVEAAVIDWFLRWARDRSWTWLLDPWRAAHLAPLNPGARGEKERANTKRAAISSISSHRGRD
jgi:hypothetical protein